VVLKEIGSDLDRSLYADAVWRGNFFFMQGLRMLYLIKLGKKKIPDLVNGCVGVIIKLILAMR
jgi:hypothetical protein